MKKSKLKYALSLVTVLATLGAFLVSALPVRADDSTLSVTPADGTLTYGTSGSKSFTVANTFAQGDPDLYLCLAWDSEPSSTTSVWAHDGSSFTGDVVLTEGASVVTTLELSTGNSTPAGTYGFTIYARETAWGSDACTGGTKSATSNLVIAPKAIVISPDSGQKKVYGASDPTFVYSATGLLDADKTPGVTGSLTRESGEDVGDYAFNVVNLYAGPNYTLSLAEGAPEFSITTRELTISGLSVEDRFYNGSDVAALTGTPELVGVLDADKANVSRGGTASAKFASKNVSLSEAGAVQAQAITVTGYSITGEAAGNYTLIQPSGLTAKINPALVIATAGSHNGTYDSTVHSLSACVVTGTYTTGVSCTNTYTGTLGTNVDDPSVEISAEVAYADGELASNFKVTSVPGSYAITPAPVTATAGSFSGPYDGDVHDLSACEVAAVSPSTYVGALTCDNTPAADLSKNAGTVEVNATVVLNGEDRDNFAISVVNGSYAIAKVNPISCTVTGYDSGYTATGHGASGNCTGLGSDTLAALQFSKTLAGTYTDDSPTYTDVPGGKIYWKFTDTSGNYNNATGNVDITIAKVDPSSCEVTGYDGGYNALGHGASGSCTGLGSDVLAALQFSKASMGTYSATSPTYKDVTGGKIYWKFVDTSGNYNNKNGDVEIKIAPKPLTLAAPLTVASSKVYDGNTSAKITSAKPALWAAVAPGASGAAGKPYTGDVVRLKGAAVGTYNSADVASANKVVFSGLSLDGAQKGNYTLTITGDQAATISAKPLTLSVKLAVAASKVYDGTTSAVLTNRAPSLVGKVGSDAVTLAGTAIGTYNSKNVATASTVAFSGLSLAGAKRGNYTLTLTAPQAAKISAKPLALSAKLTVAASKAYDGTTAASITSSTPALSGVVGGDDVTLLGTAVATYNSKDVSKASRVTFSGLSLDGADKGNYSFAITGPQAAKITKKTVTIILKDQAATFGTPYTLLTAKGGGFTTSDLAAGESINVGVCFQIKVGAKTQCLTATTATTPVGKYNIVGNKKITPAAGTLLANYTVNVVAMVGDIPVQLEVAAH